MPSATAAAAALLLLQAGPRMLGPREIVERVEKLEATVSIAESREAPVPVERFANELWPQRGKDTSAYYTVKTSEGGRRDVVPVEFSNETMVLARAGDKAFREDEFEEAEKLYRKGLEKDPDSFLLLSHLGDCAFARRRYAEALELYDRAILTHPTDHRLWWYRGQALARLGRMAPAHASIAQSLVLRPHYPQITEWLDRSRGDLGIRLDDTTFRPEVLAKADGPGVKVFWGPAGAHWLAYGLCKALWIIDPVRRKEVTGSEAHNFNSFEEKECLVNLVSVYLGDERIPRDPGLDRLHRILADGMGDGFVLYELGSRIAPWVTLTLSDADQQAIRRYVMKYVLVPVEEKPAGAAPGAP